METGSLVIRGCTIKITGFAEQEFLNEKQRTEQVQEKENKVMSLVESKRHKYRYLKLDDLIYGILTKLTVDYKLYTKGLL